MITISNEAIDLFREYIDYIIDSREEPEVYFAALNIRDAAEYMLANNTKELALYVEDLKKGLI